MTEDEAVAQILARIEAIWPTLFAAGAAPPLTYQNQDFAPPLDGSGNPLPWVRVEIEFTPVAGMGGGNMGQISIGAPGDNIHRKWGLVIGQCFAPEGSGDTAALTNAALFGTVFQGADFDGIAGLTATVHPGMKSDASDGNWWCRAASCPFFFDQES